VKQPLEKYYFTLSQSPFGLTFFFQEIAIGIDHFQSGFYDEACTYFTAAVSTALPNTKDSAEAYFWLAQCLEQMMRPAEALRPYRSAFQCYQTLDDLKGQAVTLCNMGCCFEALERYVDALECHKQDLQIALIFNDVIALLRSRHNMAVVLLKTGRISEAIDQAKQVISLAEKINNLSYQGIACETLAFCELRGGNKFRVNKAVTSFEKALELHGKANDRRGEHRVLGQLAHTYAAEKIQLAKDKAIAAAEQQIQIAIFLDDNVLHAAGLGNLGFVLSQYGELQNALEYHNKHYDKATLINNRNEQLTALSNIGTCLILLNRIQEAKSAYTEMKQLATLPFLIEKYAQLAQEKLAGLVNAK